MKRTVLLSTVAILALTSAAVAQTQQEPRRVDPPRASSPTSTTPSSTPNTSSSTPSKESSQNQPSSSANRATQNQPAAQSSQNQPAQKTEQPSNQSTQNQPAQNKEPSNQATQRSTQPSTAQQKNDAAPSKQQSSQSPSNQQGASAPANNNTARAEPSAQQQTQIASAVRQQNVSPVRVNFNIGVGVAVPRSVRLSALPSSIVSIVPRYRGYSYFVTEERIVIVEPRTHKIVYVMPYEGGARAAARPASHERVKLSNEQRAYIKKHATRKATTTTGSGARIRVEEEIPADVELEEFSEEIVREVPSVRTYRYIQRDDDVVVIDPGSRRVLEVIR